LIAHESEGLPGSVVAVYSVDSLKTANGEVIYVIRGRRPSGEGACRAFLRYLAHKIKVADVLEQTMH